MDIETAGFLLSKAGRALTAQADALRAERADTLMALTRLRRAASPERAAAAWELGDLRGRGAAKFGAAAAQMFFVREALEQASSARAAAYHARRFVAAGVSRVADLCGGIGGDALAFARAGLGVTLYEMDPVRALFARANVSALGMGDKIAVVEGDVTEARIEAPAAWFDPARRAEARRVIDPLDYVPSLLFVDVWKARGLVDVGVKLSPGINHAVAEQYGAGLEFVSDGGECKEALLWRGGLRRGENLCATKLTEDGAVSLCGQSDEGDGLGVAAGGRFLYEPDPAVIRAHLVGTLAGQLNAGAVYPQIAYLLGETFVETPWATAYEVVERLPYSRRRLQAALSDHGVGRVVIKKRGFPQEPDEVRRQLKLSGTREMIVVLTRGGDGHLAFLCRLAHRRDEEGSDGD